MILADFNPRRHKVRGTIVYLKGAERKTPDGFVIPWRRIGTVAYLPEAGDLRPSIILDEPTVGATS